MKSLKKIQPEGKLKIKNLEINRNIRGNPHQENTRHRKENLRHWIWDRGNGYLGQRNC